jgi:hypothetical protein
LFYRTQPEGYVGQLLDTNLPTYPSDTRHLKQLMQTLLTLMCVDVPKCQPHLSADALTSPPPPSDPLLARQLPSCNSDIDRP